MPHCHRANLCQENAFDGGIPRKTGASGGKRYRHVANSSAGRVKVTVEGSSKGRKIVPGSGQEAGSDPACCPFVSSTCRALPSFSALFQVRPPSPWRSMADFKAPQFLARPLPWKPLPLPSNTATCEGSGGVTPAFDVMCCQWLMARWSSNTATPPAQNA